MASCRAFAVRHDAALVTLAVLVAMALLVAGADAGRWSHKHRHHHHRGPASPPGSPPAPPGFDDQPSAAPSPPFVGDGPAASPFTQSWSHRGSDVPVADSGPSVAPADSPLPCVGSPRAAPARESGLY